MSAARPTPGPWRVEGRKVMAKTDKQVCEVPSCGCIHGKVDMANARLIAAAPDLLQALKLCLSRLGEPITEDEREVVSAARSAIAKVKAATPTHQEAA